jgi:hypothetical protein
MHSLKPLKPLVRARPTQRPFHRHTADVSTPSATGPDEPPLPEPVRELITRFIASVAELEALLLLYNEPQLRWDVGAIAKRLYISEAHALTTLRTLTKHGLASVSDDYWRYQPRDPALADAVCALSTLYSRRLVVITALIHGKSGSGIAEFARAFVLRRKD